jgi:aryl-alcohol dehydrogenase-like predicted oxidoreductase
MLQWVVTRELGSGGPRLPAIGLGCMGMVGWYGERDDVEARATIDRALELGITHLDTAAIYQDGASERFVGDCIRGRRERVFIASKCGLVHQDDGRIVADGRPSSIVRSCEESLARLGTDYIDLFYVHRVDRSVPVEESLQAMAALVKAGKIRYVGLSEASAETLARAHAVHPVTALQSELSLWTQSASRPALQACAELGIAFVAYSPLGRGFLTGTITDGAALVRGDTRSLFPRFSPAHLQGNLELARRVGELARQFGCSPAQLAIAWVLAQGAHVHTIPGTKKPRYLEENASAGSLRLSASQLDAIADAIPESMVAGERYPESMMGALNA